MFEYYTVYNAQTALVAGLITSVHCVAMCGPLACAWGRPQQLQSPRGMALADLPWAVN
jgi:sulfite exporter TauE/SafE